MTSNSHVVAAASGIAVLASLAFTYHYLYGNSGDEIVEGKLRCNCGKVEANFRSPKTTPTAACHCEDCIGVVEWSKTCKQCSKDLLSTHGAVQMVQMYKQELTWIKGQENLRRILLRENSQLERFYATCCGTPIGFTSATLKAFPFFVVYRDLLTYTNDKEFNPVGYRLNVSKVPVESRSWRGSTETAQEAEGVSAAFLTKLISRLMYGIAVGKNEPDPTAAISTENREILHLNEPNSKE